MHPLLTAITGINKDNTMNMPDEAARSTSVTSAFGATAERSSARGLQSRRPENSSAET